MIPSIYYVLGSLTMVVWIIVGVAEVLKSYRRLGIPLNPVFQETCWSCHRILGDDVAIACLARNTYRIICGHCAKKKANRRLIYSYERMDFLPDRLPLPTDNHMELASTHDGLGHKIERDRLMGGHHGKD
ncbi:MAG TPA: hypothetical protein PL124_12585 [Candidatus Cloacimonadota bacterium]|nr:hypothetical protein [Candidatus Cloacimonadota bacterium]HPS40248.1 hypothetical protein [Candidatus Cloacimonadota bacterium]